MDGVLVNVGNDSKWEGESIQGEVVRMPFQHWASLLPEPEIICRVGDLAKSSYCVPSLPSFFKLNPSGQRSIKVFFSVGANRAFDSS